MKILSQRRYNKLLEDEKTLYLIRAYGVNHINEETVNLTGQLTIRNIKLRTLREITLRRMEQSNPSSDS